MTMTNITQQGLKNNTTAQSTDNVRADSVRLSIDNYRFKSRRKNPEWTPEKLILLRSCHIHNKAEISEVSVYMMSKTPKWLTILEKESIDQNTGEIFYSTMRQMTLKLLGIER